jgi:hypothetical protein
MRGAILFKQQYFPSFVVFKGNGKQLGILRKSVDIFGRSFSRRQVYLREFIVYTYQDLFVVCLS